MSILNYKEAVTYLEETPRFTTKHSLEYIKECLHRLGNPQEAFRVIHVAGTNGKGSVCAYLASVFRAGGYRCGLFTSPHLIRMNERFQIDGEPADDELFLQAFEKVKEMIDELVAEGNHHPNFFETIFLMGMWMFQRACVPYVILETGLGGKIDATNVIERPLACAITSISLDHVQVLGDTVEIIAAEKAGIIKPGVPIIYDANHPETARVIEEQARSTGAPACPVRKEQFTIQKITSQGIDFILNEKENEADVFSIPFIARYQVMNAALALRTLEALKGQVEFTDEQVRKGIAGTRWQGRMETILPGIVVDGAHNEDGVASFLETAADFREIYRIVLLFSAVDDKDYPDMIRRICQELKPAAVVTATLQTQRGVDAQVLAEEFRKGGCSQVLAEDSVKKAFEKACSLRGDGLLFCVGSLYLVGEVKSLRE